MNTVIGKKIKGFKFEETHNLGYNQKMDNYIDKIGTIIQYEESDDTYRIEFEDNEYWHYPAQLVEEIIGNSTIVNNLDIIKPLLNFSELGDFYMLYILKRKKDQPAEERDNHQSVRTVKTYCIESIDHLIRRWDEIIQMCEMFKARAYIHVQKQNHRDVSLNMMVALAQRIQDGNLKQHGLFDSVVGQVKTQEKRWIVDIDTKDDVTVHRIAHIVDGLRPEGPKIEAVIPTKNGYHFITKRFDVLGFNKKLSEYGEVPDIQKKNPTLLYYPKSLG
jgi:hypothetical protein